MSRSYFIWKSYGIRALQIEELMPNKLILHVFFHMAGNAPFW